MLKLLGLKFILLVIFIILKIYKSKVVVLKVFLSKLFVFAILVLKVLVVLVILSA